MSPCAGLRRQKWLWPAEVNSTATLPSGELRVPGSDVLIKATFGFAVRLFNITHSALKTSGAAVPAARHAPAPLRSMCSYARCQRRPDQIRLHVGSSGARLRKSRSPVTADLIVRMRVLDSSLSTLYTGRSGCSACLRLNCSLARTPPTALPPASPPFAPFDALLRSSEPRTPSSFSSGAAPSHPPTQA